jgi:leucyl-tRNA synthetase
LLESSQRIFKKWNPNVNTFPTLGFSPQPIHVDVNIVDGVELDIEEFKKWKGGEFTDAEFILEDGKYICGTEVEKMSKRYFNTVNPNSLCEKYGADTFRMYEMFLGPVEMSKPWDTKGIEGVHRFLKKLWRLFFDELKGKVWSEEKATDAELKVLHKTIKKIEEDTERFSFNTGVSTFMICVNDLTDLKCHKKEILEQLLILLTPYAPHISEELWSVLGNKGTILDVAFPKWNDKYLKETSKAYPVAINGKTRSELTIALDATQQQVEEIVLKDAIVMKWLEGNSPQKIFYVRTKMSKVVVESYVSVGDKYL